MLRDLFLGTDWLLFEMERREREREREREKRMGMDVVKEER